MRKLVTILLLVLPVALAGQDWEWGITAGGPYYPEEGRALTVDQEGFVYVTGAYRDFGFFGPNFYGTNGASDLFLVKFSPNGNVKWFQKMGGSGADIGRGIHLDGLGNVLVVGQAKFGPIQPPGNNLTPKPGGPGDGSARHLRDAVIGKYSTNGGIQWVKVGDGLVFTEGYDITTDPSGAVYATGIQEGDSWFGNDTARGIGADDIFLVKYSAMGDPVWAKSFGGIGSDGYPHLTSNTAGHLFLAGTFRDTSYFGNDTLFAQSGREAFLGRLDTSGNFVWIQSFLGPGNERIEGLDVSPDGHLYLSGSFEQSLVLGSDTIQATAGNDLFLAKFDINGNHKWTRTWAGTGGDFMADLACAGDTQLYLTGSFDDTLFLGGDTLVSAGFPDVILFSTDSSGQVKFHRNISTPKFELPFGVATDAGNNAYLTGFYNDSLIFNQDTIRSWGGEDIFIAKFSEARQLILENLTGYPWCTGESLTAEFSVRGCFDSTNTFYLELSDSAGSFSNPTRLDSVSGMFGGNFSATLPGGLPRSGAYRMRVSSSAPAFSSGDNGFDLWISTDSIYPIPISGDTLICPPGDSVQLGAGNHLSYLWSTGDTTSSIFVDTAGSYEVTVVDSGGCTQTGTVTVSVCISREAWVESGLSVQPNPATDFVRIHAEGRPGQDLSIRLLDLQGRSLQVPVRREGQTSGWELDLRGLSAGLYLIELRSGEKSYRSRLVKK